MTPIQETIINKKTNNSPIWLMRQAGRYLPEFREIRKLNPNFIDLCLNEEFIIRNNITAIKKIRIRCCNNLFGYFNVALWIKSKSRI